MGRGTVPADPVPEDAHMDLEGALGLNLSGRDVWSRPAVCTKDEHLGSNGQEQTPAMLFDLGMLRRSLDGGEQPGLDAPTQLISVASGLP